VRKTNSEHKFLSFASPFFNHAASSSIHYFVGVLSHTSAVKDAQRQQNNCILMAPFLHLALNPTCQHNNDNITFLKQQWSS